MGNKWGGYTQRQDKSNAKPFAGKKTNTVDKQPYWTRVIGGIVTLKDKAAEAKCPCQCNFKK